MQVGARFSAQTALTARLMMYGLLAIVLMAMDHRGQYVPRFRSLAGHLVEPVHYIVEWPVRALRGVFGFLQSTQSLRRENSALQRDLLQQKASLQRLGAMMEENARLRALLDGASSRQGFDFQFAELIEVDLDPFSHKIIINHGRDRGIVSGQAVIDGAGIMGQVEDVFQGQSTVRLISDPNHALPVQINRTGLRTIAFGVGDTAHLSMPAVPREADVRIGDLVVTSGLGGRFPSGYPVAIVASVDRREGQTFAQVLATPVAALDRGREVLLLKSAAEEPAAVPTAEEPGAEEPSAEETSAGEPEAEEPAPPANE